MCGELCQGHEHDANNGYEQQHHSNHDANSSTQWRVLERRKGRHLNYAASGVVVTDPRGFEVVIRILMLGTAEEL